MFEHPPAAPTHLEEVIMRTSIVLGLALVSTTATVALAGEPQQPQQPQQNDLSQIVEELRSKLESQQATLDAQQRQIQSQSTEIEELRGQVPAEWLTEQRANEIRGLVADVLADADTRASLLQGGAIAGHDGKAFFIGSADGNFLLKVGGQIQPRYIANIRDQTDDVLAPPIDEHEFGFQLRRVKLWFDGHVGSPKLTYRVQLAADRDTSGVDLEEGSLGYASSDELRVFVGQFSSPFVRDSFTSNARQLAVERSAVSYIFVGNDNYTQGAGLDWRPGDMWRVRATVNDGIASGNKGGTGPGFQNTPNDFHNDATDFAATGRVDLKIAGQWKQMDDFSAWDGEDTAAFVGAAIHYEAAESGDGQTSGTTAATGPYDDFIIYTIDGSIETGGFNIFAEFVGQSISATDLNPAGDMDNYGFVVQGGYMVVPDKFEPFARYEMVSIDNAPDDLSLITAGFNYYWKAHSMKFTADVVYSMEPLTAANTMNTSMTGAGLLPDNANADEQIALRAQFQLLF
jgi:phosphate-selective porin OprO/OprP